MLFFSRTDARLAHRDEVIASDFQNELFSVFLYVRASRNFGFFMISLEVPGRCVAELFDGTDTQLYV